MTIALPFPPPPMDRWGISAQLEVLSGGNRNQVCRTFGLVNDWVFKTTRRTEQALEWLEDVHRNAEKTGFLVPKLERSISGNYMENRWTMEPFIQGQTVTAAQLSQIEPQVRTFHTLSENLPQRPNFCDAYSLQTGAKHTDFDLADLPRGLVRECLFVWQELKGATQSVVHGDLNCSNVLKASCGTPVLLDWDETRKDACIFDLGAISQGAGLSQKMVRALDAWEIACSWKLERKYAEQLTQKFLKNPSTS